MATFRTITGHRLAVYALAFFALLSPHSRAQNSTASQPNQTPTSTQAETPDQAARKALATNATAFVIARERLDPNAIVPGTGNPLGSRGTWGITTIRPTTCPPSTDNCARVVYRVADTPVSCEWTVIINPDSTGTILEQNPDSIRYMLRVVPTNELAPLVITRSMQLGTRAQGVVEVTLIVSPTGEPTKAVATSGPEPLRFASTEIAKQWVFKPLMAGNRAIPFMTTIKLTYGGGKIKSEP
jgi:hypothetical protein